jgi:hypothetical protein
VKFFKWLAELSTAKRRLMYLQSDIELALALGRNEEEKHENLGLVLQKHDPEGWARLQRKIQNEKTASRAPEKVTAP